jgi:coiled-coil domain-containing protein 12
MELEAKKRRERLLALKNRSNSTKEENSDDTQNDANNTNVVSTAENIAKEIMSQNSSTNVLSAVDLSKLAPKKPTWDLERDLQKKRNKLEQETRRAIAEITSRTLVFNSCRKAIKR